MKITMNVAFAEINKTKEKIKIRIHETKQTTMGQRGRKKATEEFQFYITF